jgi:hypothetical protein
VLKLAGYPANLKIPFFTIITNAVVNYSVTFDMKRYPAKLLAKSKINLYPIPTRRFVIHFADFFLDPVFGRSILFGTREERKVSCEYMKTLPSLSPSWEEVFGQY